MVISSKDTAKFIAVGGNSRGVYFTPGSECGPAGEGKPGGLLGRHTLPAGKKTGGAGMPRIWGSGVLRACRGLVLS